MPRGQQKFPAPFKDTKTRPPKVKEKPSRTRGPKGLQRATGEFEHHTTVPAAPPNWQGSEPEWGVYWAHTQLGLQEGLDFSYQASAIGGRQEFGGLVLDFVELDIPIAINVQGTFFHYRSTPKILADQVAKNTVAAMGITLIFIDEQAALTDPIPYVKDARNGIDRSLGSNLLVA